MGAGGEALLNPVLHTLRYRKVVSDRCLQSLLVKLGRRLDAVEASSSDESDAAELAGGGGLRASTVLDGGDSEGTPVLLSLWPRQP